MRLKILILFVLILPHIYAQSVIKTITAPVNASGLCWDGEYLWCGAYGINGDTIYKINPADGTILKKIRWRQNADCYGLAYDNGNLWVSEHISGAIDSIFLIDTISGARINAIPSWKEYMSGLANDGTFLWHTVYYNPDGRVYKINKTNGFVLDSINIPNIPQPWGATWDGTYLWVCNDGNYGGSHRIYKINVDTKLIIDSLNSPGTRPWGLAWDGNYLWVAAGGTSPTGFLFYQIDLGGAGTPDILVLPTSYNFGFVPIDSIRFFTLNISNTGDANLVIDTIFSNQAAFYPEGSSYPVVIQPQNTKNISVFFSPDNNIFYSSNLIILSNDPDEDTVSISLSGRGVFTEPTMILSHNLYDFGNVGVNYVKDFYLKITNEGYLTLTIDSLVFSNEVFFTRNNLPVQITTCDTESIQITVNPNQNIPFNALLNIYSNDPFSNPATISLSATGDSVYFNGGEIIWSYPFTVNVCCVAPIDDINNDNIPDIAVESYYPGTDAPEHLNIFFGNSFQNGVLLWQFGDVTHTGSWGDNCLIQGDDYNSDGLNDIILGTAWGDRKVYVIDAKNGNIIWYYDTRSYDGEGGWVYAVKPIPDINGDGIGEVIAGVGGNSTPGGGPRAVYCFSGSNGNILWYFRAQDGIGSVDYIPDVNGDNVPDVICGAWGNSYDKRVYCISGASTGYVSSPLWSYNCGGDVMSCISIPDVNGDGIYDVIAGSWSDSVFCLSGSNGSKIWSRFVGDNVIKVVKIPALISPDVPGIAVANLSSTFYVLNGSNGNIYWSFSEGDNFWSVDIINDLDGDGKYEVLAGNQVPGKVYCFSGNSGNIIWSYDAQRLIYSIRATHDINFDGYPDVIAGTQAPNNQNAFLLAICGGTPSVSVYENIKDHVKIYPIIGKEKFFIDYNGIDIKEIIIFDMLGRTVIKHKVRIGEGRFIWNVNRNTPPGIYFIKIKGDKINITQKVNLLY